MPLPPPDTPPSPSWSLPTSPLPSPPPNPHLVSSGCRHTVYLSWAGVYALKHMQEKNHTRSHQLAGRFPMFQWRIIVVERKSRSSNVKDCWTLWQSPGICSCTLANAFHRYVGPFFSCCFVCLFLITLPHTVFRGFVSISGDWMQLCKELSTPGDSPHVFMQVVRR